MKIIFLDSLIEKLPADYRLIAEKNKIEIVQITVAFIALTISSIVYISSSRNEVVANNVKEDMQIEINTEEEKWMLEKDLAGKALGAETGIKNAPDIYVEISGAVNKPKVYKVDYNARLYQVIEKAGGLSEEADKQYFSRNFNLAKTLTDQEKIHIPSYTEIQMGIFKEEKTILEYMGNNNTKENSSTTISSSEENNSEGGINVNTATSKELETLPKIGKVTAQKIIDGRPYNSKKDLLDKKVLTQSVYDGVESKITVE